MRVLLLNQIPEVNNKYTFSLARALLKIDVDVTVCGIETDNYDMYSDVKCINIFKSYSGIKNPFSKVVSYYRSWENVVRYCVDNKIEIVHTQWNIFSPLDYYFHNLLRRDNIHIVVTIHDLLPFNKKFYDPGFHKKIYTSADAIINQAHDNYEKLISDFTVKPKKIKYIPHGNYMDYAEIVEKKESRKKLNLPSDRPIVLFFGQIKKVKGVGTLIDAIEIVKKDFPDIYCLIAGKVWKDDYKQYNKQIVDLQLHDNIKTEIAYIPDEEVKYYFCASDIVALPYLQVYQSGVVLLAYAYERPVVATRTGEFETVVIDNETGILSEPGDKYSLAKGILYYLNNPDIAIKQAKSGKQDLSVRLNWSTISGQVKDVYEEVLI